MGKQPNHSALPERLFMAWGWLQLRVILLTGRVLLRVASLTHGWVHAAAIGALLHLSDFAGRSGYGRH